MTERLTFRWWSMLWSSARGYRLFARVSRMAQWPIARRRRIRRAPFPFSRWTEGRDLPAIARKTFRERWRQDHERGT